MDRKWTMPLCGEREANGFVERGQRSPMCVWFGLDYRPFSSSTTPGEEELSGTWKKRAAWVKQLIPIRNDVSHGRAVSEDNYAFLVELREWFLSDQ